MDSVRKDTVKKYLDKYSLAVVDVENSLEQYNSFYKNMGFEGTIEGIIRQKLEDKIFVRIMDLGCGNAGFLRDLKKEFDEEVHTIGVDLLAPENKPDELVLGDALETTFPKEVDLVFSFRSLHEIGEPEKLVQKVYDSLSKGGKAFLSFRAMDLYVGGIGLAELGEKEVRQLQKMVQKGKLSSFSVKGFEVNVKNEKGKDMVCGVNIFLEK